jgi:predicted secreted Zn-dependent protease
MPRLPVVMLAAGTWLALPAGAEVSTHTDTEHYEIRGTTAAQLRAEMNARGPAGADGRRYDGYTRWYVSWRYTFQRSGACAIDRVSTTVKVTTTLPRWADEARADAALQATWRRYTAALATHEDGHARNGLGAARDIDAALARLPPEPNCDAMGARANAVANGILRQYNQRDLDYDRETAHGTTQGARFP